jgi:hypothetical protein
LETDEAGSFRGANIHENTRATKGSHHFARNAIAVRWNDTMRSVAPKPNAGCKRRALLKDLVKSMSAEGVTDVDFALQRMMKDDRQVAGWRGLLAGLQPLDREVLLQVMQGNALLGQDTLRALRNIASLKPTMARVAQSDDLEREKLRYL